MPPGQRNNWFLPRVSTNLFRTLNGLLEHDFSQTAATKHVNLNPISRFIRSHLVNWCASAALWQKAATVSSEVSWPDESKETSSTASFSVISSSRAERFARMTERAEEGRVLAAESSLADSKYSEGIAASWAAEGDVSDGYLKQTIRCVPLLASTTFCHLDFPNIV